MNAIPAGAGPLSNTFPKKELQTDLIVNNLSWGVKTDKPSFYNKTEMMKLDFRVIIFPDDHAKPAEANVTFSKRIDISFILHACNESP